jgi:hypothetical protein
MTKIMNLSRRIALSAILATSVVSTASAESMSFFRIGTGSAGGTYFPIGGLIANAISNPPGSRPCSEGGSCGVPGLVAIAQSTNASAHNATAINAGQMEGGLVDAAVLYYAYHGEGMFKGKQKQNLRFLASLYPEDMHLTMPKGDKLSSLADLKGKRVGISPAGSGTQLAVEMILGSHGVNRDNIDEAELNSSQAAERIADGQLDANFFAGGTPLASFIQLDNTKGMELYSFSPAEIKDASKVVPYYVASTIPAGTYQGVTYDVKTIAVNSIFVVSADLPEEQIYQITKALWSKHARKLFDNGHAKGKRITLETALDGYKGLNVPLHPGAERFYKEAGLL